jgi:hypothetical protein
MSAFPRVLAGAACLTIVACAGDRTRGIKEDAGESAPIIDAGATSDAGLVVDAGEALDAAVPADAGQSVDSGELADAGPEELDAGPADAGPPDAGSEDAGPEDAGGCTPPPESYACDPSDPSTCPGGTCIASLCIGQVVDAGWYSTCGNGVCDPCETPQECPADCAPPPTLTGTKSYNDPKTISIYVHGFTSHSSTNLATTTFGALTGCSDLGAAMATYEPQIPCAADSPTADLAPNSVAAMEYYGDLPPPWMSAADVMEVEQYPYVNSTLALQRYGLIVAKFIKWRLAYTGADYVNLVCHSMGCEISRYVLENDIEQLASTQKIVRWETNAGVLAGAQLARLYDNPTVQMFAGVLGLGSVSDFAIMEPSYVQQYVAVYDHQLYEGNNPLLAGILIHHVGASDPTLPQAEGLSLLDDIPNENPGDNPNDGIMFTFDEFFHSQSPAASVTTPSGLVMASSHSFDYIDHIDEPSSEAAHMLMAAGLFHQRKVIVTLQSVTLNTDFELHSNDPTTWLMTGAPPAEVVAETTVDYDSYTLPTFGTSATIHVDKIAYRTADMYQQAQGSAMMPGEVIFEAPVFDDQTDFDLNVTLTETDYYGRYSLTENALGATGISTDQTIATYAGLNEPLTDHTIPFSDSAATVQLEVQVVNMY